MSASETTCSDTAQPEPSLYQPLQPDEIRLIKLHPKTSDSDRVSCTLITTKLQDALEYVALSYVWGSEEDALSIQLKETNSKMIRHIRDAMSLVQILLADGETHCQRQELQSISKSLEERLEELDATIQLNGRDFKVMRNLKDALSSLQPLEEELLMWVDALSINQSDIPERNLQVPRMLDIYAAATCVVAWLGKGNPNFERMIGCIANTPDAAAKVDVKDRRTWCEIVDNFDPEADTKLLWMEHWLYFISLRYFRRVWVMQEIAYASKAYVVYGEQIASYHHLHEFVDGIMHRLVQTEDLPRGICPVEHAKSRMIASTHTVRSFFRPPTGQALTGIFFGLAEWLQHCSRRCCQDPRDKVYGFYGCFPPSIRDRIVIDYSKPVTKVFSEMTRAVIEVLGCLIILDYIDNYRTANAAPVGLPLLVTALFNA